MLAKKFEDRWVTYPGIIQPKLDGIRCLAFNGQLQSRDEHLWQPNILGHIEYQLKNLPKDIVFDGELYVHGWSLQKINSACSVVRVTPAPLTYLVGYHIYDFFSPEEPGLLAHVRQNLLNHYFKKWDKEQPGKIKKIERVKTKLVANQRDVLRYHKEFVSEGYEGAIFRDFSAPYGTEQTCTNKENRWNVLLKVKNWEDAWFKVIDLTEGKGKHLGRLGAFVCEAFNGKSFNVGTGFTDEQRRYWYSNTAPETIHVRYERLSDEGIPLKPTFLEAPLLVD